MIRFQRKCLNLAMLLTNCQCDKLSLLSQEVMHVRALSVSPCLRRNFRFQNLFTEDFPEESSQQKNTQNLLYPMVSPSQPAQAQEQNISQSEVDGKSDQQLQDAEQCLKLSFKKFFFTTKDELIMFHTSLENSFKNLKTIFSKEELMNCLQRVNMSDYSAALTVDFKRASPAELLSIFCCVTSFTVRSKLSCSDSTFTPLFEALADNMNDFSDLQLLLVGKNLALWSESENQNSLIALQEALDEECVQRFLKYWRKPTHYLKFQLMMADVFYWIGQGNPHKYKYLQIAVPNMTQKALRSHSKLMLQVLFYYCCVSFYLQQAKEVPRMLHVQQIINICSFEEILIGLCCCINHAKGWKRTSLPLSIKTFLISKTMKRLENDNFLFLFSKVFQRVQIRASDYSFVYTLQQSLVDRAETMSLDTCISLINLGRSLNVDCAEFTTKVLKRISRHVPSFESDILLILLSSFTLNKESREFFDDAVDELKKRGFPRSRSVYGYQSINQKLLQNDIFAESVYLKCMSEYYLIPEKNIDGLIAKFYLEPDSLIEIFYPTFKGPRLGMKDKQKLFTILQQSRKTKEPMTVLDAIKNDVFNCLHDFTDCVLPLNVLPHAQQDFVLCTDEDGSFHPVTHFRNFDEWEVKHIPESALSEGKRFIVVWFVPKTGRKYNNELTSYMWAKQKALKQLGYSTIQVDVEKWQNSSKDDGGQSCRLWLSSMLQSVIFRSR